MRRFGLGVVGALAATLLPLGPAASPLGLDVGSNSVSAAPNDIVAVVIDGVGNGHGRGMSQWGAYGYAVEQGWQWTQILDHYYGGTVLGDVGGSQTRIKVRLVGYDGLGTVGLVSHGTGVTWSGQTRASMYAVETSAGNFDVYGSTSIACPNGVALSVPSGSPPIAQGSADWSGVRQIQTFLKAFHDGAIGVDGDFGQQTKTILTSWQTSRSLPADGIWNTDDAAAAQVIINAAGGSVPWTKLGTAAGTQVFSTSTGDASGAPATTNALGVCNASGAVTHYRGTVEVSSQTDGNRVVNNVLTEDYVRGVAPKEVSASWGSAGGGAGMNSLRAQAVAARSYGLQQNRYSYATTCDTQACQVYGGAATRSYATGTAFLVEDYRTDQAIAETAGKVRRWAAGHALAGQIVSTEFSASNGPRTAGGAFPPVDDLGDVTASNPNHRWTRVIDADSLEAQYGLGQLTDASMVEAASSQYQQFDGIWFNDIVLTGTSGSKRMQAWDFRGAFSLPSPGFTVRVIRENTTSKSFGFVGDSVGASIATGGVSEFDRLIDGTFASATIDVLSSRCTTRVSCPGLSGVEVAATLPMNLDLVVVELGYNDSAGTFASDIDAMMAALGARGVRQVLWVNMSDTRPAYIPMNAALVAAQSRWPTLTVIDWNAASSHPEARARWLSDGVHLSTTGQAEFALWLRAQVVGATPNHWLAPPKRIILPVRGRTLTGADGQPVVVPADAVSVAIIVTVVDPVSYGYVTVWPCDSAQPVTSNLNYTPREVIGNNVVAPIAGDGTICLFSLVGTNLVVDVAGWFAGDGGTQNAGMVAVTPKRLADTRIALGWPTRVSPGKPLVITVPGIAATRPDGTAVTAPVGASAISLNLAAVDPDRPGFLRAWPCSAGEPGTANLNYVSGAISNGVLSGVDPNGQVCIGSSSPTDVVVDVQGWFGPSAIGEQFTAASPKRIVDSRIGVGAPQARVQPGQPLTVQVHGQVLNIAGVATPVPSTATAAVINVAIDAPERAGYVTVWPCQGAPPLASNLNHGAGVVRSAGVIAPISPSGTICLFTLSPAELIVDITGWMAGGPGSGFTGVVPERFVDTRYEVGPKPV